jgi:hypothetical protein
MRDQAMMDQQRPQTWGEWFSDNKGKIFWAIVIIALIAGGYYYYTNHMSGQSSSSYEASPSYEGQTAGYNVKKHRYY